MTVTACRSGPRPPSRREMGAVDHAVYTSPWMKPGVMTNARVRGIKVLIPRNP